MHELMSDHKIIKNYFDDVQTTTTTTTADDTMKTASADNLKNDDKRVKDRK